MANENVEEAEVVSDEITCTKCGTSEERVAEEGVTLQPSPDYICENCQNAHNETSGAVEAEKARRNAELSSDEPVAEIEE